MMPTIDRLTVIALWAALLLATGAPAADHPISAAKLVLQRAGAKEKLVFLSQDPAFLFPPIGSADDPATGSPGGAQIELFSSAEPDGAAIAVPPGVGNPGWKVTDGAVDAFRFTNPSAPAGPSTVRKMVLVQGKKIRVIGAETGLALAGPQGSVAIRITTGSLRNCALFDASTIVRDEAGWFVGKNAVAGSLADCSSGPFSPTTTTATTSTTTTVPGVCGDGVVNPPGEQCDAPDPGTCPPGQCMPPGRVGECTCCAIGVGCGFNNVGCCDEESACRVLGPLPSGGLCYDPTCGPGDDCEPGTTCVDGGCCISSLGSTCYNPLSGDFIPCCPPAGCVPIGPGGPGRCCLPAGESCSAAADCCSGSCAGGVCG
jgi:hypothetical protein